MNAILVDPVARKIIIKRYKKSKGSDLELASNILGEPAAYYENLPNGDVLFITEAGRLELAKVRNRVSDDIFILFGKAAILRFEDTENVPTKSDPYKAKRIQLNVVSKVQHLKN